MDKVDLSIIIPVYNVKNYLERCIDSVIFQCVDKKVELLLIDDGSSDGSEHICDEYGKLYPKNIRVVHKKNGGLSSARNKGLEIARGQYICFLDSDDMLASDFVGDILKWKETKADVLHFAYCAEKHGKYNLHGSKELVKVEKSQFFDDLTKNKFGNQIGMAVYSKYLFDDIRFPEGRNYEDIATLYKLILISNTIYYIDYTYYIYNMSNSESITKSVSINNLTNMYVSINEMYFGIRSYY